MSWVGNLARMVDMRNYTKFWSENLKGRDHAEDLDVDRRIIVTVQGLTSLRPRHRNLDREFLNRPHSVSTHRASKVQKQTFI